MSSNFSEKLLHAHWRRKLMPILRWPRPRFRLSTAIACVALGGVFTGAFRGELREFLVPKPEPAKLREITTADELQQALRGERSLIFASCDWSLQSMTAKQELSRLALEWQASGGAPPTSFYLLDVTRAHDNRAPQHVLAWLASDRRLGRLAWTGAGEVVIVHRGVVVDVLAIGGISLEAYPDLSKQIRRALQ
jgi:hypothetical protein